MLIAVGETKDDKWMLDDGCRFSRELGSGEAGVSGVIVDKGLRVEV